MGVRAGVGEDVDEENGRNGEKKLRFRSRNSEYLWVSVWFGFAAVERVCGHAELFGFHGRSFVHSSSVSSHSFARFASYRW